MGQLVVLLMILAPWLAAIVFVRALFAAIRKNWRAAASSARTSTLLQVPITIGYMLLVFDYEQALEILTDATRLSLSRDGLWALRNVAALASMTLSMALGVASSVLWFVMVSATLVVRPIASSTSPGSLAQGERREG